MLPEGELERKLALGRPLRAKLGIDPTGPDIHLGFAFVLRRLRAFQDAGHIAVLIVGDYTARIGDPSGRSKERRVLPDEVLDRNAKLFAEQAFRILDRDRTEIRFNGEWLGKLDYAELVRLTRTGTVARLLERNDFAERFAAGNPISVSELLYPFAQGYDSVAIEADIEVGGTDQLYNLLMGRDVMQHYGLDPQVVVTYELLVGTDGAKKMSKSEGNYIGIDEPPDEHVREGDVDPGRGARPVVAAHARPRAARRRPDGVEARARARDRRAVARGGGRARRGGALHACRARGQAAGGGRRGGAAGRRGRSTCRRCSSSASASGRRARPAG